MIVGLAHGCFDVFHFGHLNHLEEAAQHCTELLVCITPDEFVNKGPRRPIFPAHERARVIRALKCVSHAFIGFGPDVAINALTLVKPTIFWKGSEYQNSDHAGFAKERAFCEAHGIEVRFTTAPTFSTTETLKRMSLANA